MTGLNHAYLAAKGGTARLTCTFNPTSITVSKEVEWESQPSTTQEAPESEFVGAQPRTLSMQLFFDGWNSGKGDISRDIDTLFSWTCPTPASERTNRPQPPIVVLHWGTKSYFEVCIRSLSATYTMFSPAGAPVRATVDITMEETAASAAGQNPTSGGVAGRRTRLAVQGDSLHSIAYQEYGDARCWRGIAAANGIDDPLRLAPGTQLLLPPADDAAALS